MNVRAALIAATLVASSVRGGSSPETVVAGEAGSKMDRWLADAGFRGAVLVSKGGAVVLRKGYGMADRENAIAWAPDAVFSVGSITKQFTADAILKLEAQGKVRVEDAIVRFFPDAPPDKRAITIHQLLTHTAGLESDFAGDYEAVGRDEYAARILASKLRSAPGSTFFYSNAGYSLLGAIVERASGKPYETYLSESLFLPAGMRETGYRLPKWDPRRIPVGYVNGSRWGRITEKPWAPDGPYWALRANGGIHSTLDDLLRWHVALARDAVLPAAETRKLYGRHVREGASGSYYGYGWAVSDAPGGGTLVQHNGGNRAYYADFLRYLDQDLVVILATNDSEVRGGSISHGLARLARGEQVAVPGARAEPLGEGGRDAVIRAWVDAYNAPGVEAMRAFREAHARPRPEVDDAERDRGLERMRGDLGRLEAEGVVERSARAVTVRTKSARGPVALLRFEFHEDGKLDAIGVEIGG
jgi:CubicO group peptidase (beta-lactamase class C family)